MWAARHASPMAMMPTTTVSVTELATKQSMAAMMNATSANSANMRTHLP